jgi:hypothetical protein
MFDDGRAHCRRPEETTVPHKRPEDLNSTEDRWPIMAAAARSNGRKPYGSETWGDLEVALTMIDTPIDCTEMYQVGGLPGGVCPCPHYGYVFEGVIRATYPNTEMPDEVVIAGEAYFIPAGHVLIYEEPTKTLEFHPAYAFQVIQDGLERAIQKMGARAGIDKTSESTTDS